MYCPSYTTSQRPNINVSRTYRAGHVLGKGSYGTVYCACVTDTLGYYGLVAVKAIRPFSSTLKCVRTLREIRILRHFKHEKIIRLLDVTTVGARSSFSTVFLVQELMDANLDQRICDGLLQPQHIQFIIYQILRGLKAMHSAGIMHRDLKPANILVNENCDVKLCDFGLARSIPFTEEAVQDLTMPVATRWYRAPEVVFERGYGPSLDIWSAG